MSDAQPARTQIVASALEDWTKRLVGLDGRNRMLYFRELTAGTLDISPTSDGISLADREKLLAGEHVALSDLFDAEAVADAARRIRAIAAKAQSNFEEKGLATLYIAHTFASWKRPEGREPRAPVVLLPLSISLADPQGEDASLGSVGQPEVNLAFLHAMEHDFGLDPYPAESDRPEDSLAWLDHIESVCGAVPDFELFDQTFIANLDFSKLPIIHDMERHPSLFDASDLVAALAGDEEARQDLARGIDVDTGLPDSTLPHDEFLVCDSDGSQNHAVVAALRGHSLVIHGPPGTGKSQTIANMISSLAAAGKTVLFVAEKRAAIGAVARRLEGAGCGQLVLDLHDGSGRRQVARSLGASIASIDRILTNREMAPHAELEFSRTQLVAHRTAMHEMRKPYKLSFSDLQSMVGTEDSETTGLRVAQGFLDEWTEPGRAILLSLLTKWQLISERLHEDPSQMWSSAAIRLTEDADVAKGIVDLVTSLSPAVESAFESALTQLAVPPESAAPVTELSELLVTMNRLSDRYEPSFAKNARSIARALRPVERSALSRLYARMFDGDYRRALSSLPSHGIVDASLREVLRDARRIGEAEDSWARWFPNHPIPGRSASAAPLAAALDDYNRAVERLVMLVPRLAEIDGFEEQDRVIRAMSAHKGLADAKAHLAKTAKAISEFGLGPLLRRLDPGRLTSMDLRDTAMRIFAVSAINDIVSKEPELEAFSGTLHQQVAERFAELDGRHLRATSQRVLRRVATRAAAVMKKEQRQTILVQHEAAASAHFMPVRQLLASAPAVVQALRPCWAMSPLLASRLLPPTPGLFDFVIFDEASQVLPVDAIPSIARANQIVVAGDRHQLPPSVFVASDSMEDQAQTEASVDGETAPTDSESILDAMRDLLTEQELLWHYRSQDERLIDFSNTHIYDNALVSFPGTNQGTGVRHILTDGLPVTTEETTNNPAVVRSVVDQILEHAIAHREESLGVIASSVRHANAIVEALRIARSKSGSDHDGFFEDKGAEPFFVKTMDMAQGVERDHVIFSIGFGKNPEGEMVYRWGALSNRGGERRLNVAITRAKRRMTVVSSITSKDIDTTRTRSRGAALLAEFLEYAESEGAAMTSRSQDTSLTPFETSVVARLTAAGIPLQPRYGVGSLRIDFAAFDDEEMTLPVLAIETDGIGYNASATVRDRDRLRREVLLRRGWRYHRIWSIDWYRDPAGQTAKALEAWQRAVRQSRDPSLSEVAGPAREYRPVVAGRGRSPIAIRRAGILAYERAELVQLVQWIQSDGIARTDDEMMTAAMDVLGFTDAGGRVGRALRGAIGEAGTG